MSEVAEPTMRRGSVNKCPSCGAQLAAFVSACGACGHEFVDIAANRSIAAMVARFESIERDSDLSQMRSAAREQAIFDRKARVIRDFPVPNSREDLQQLLHFIQPKLLPSVKPDPNVEDWRAKFNEVIGRARFAYKDDGASLAEFDRMEKALSVTLGADLRIKARRNPWLMVLLVAAALFAVAAIVQHQRTHAATLACEASYDAAAAKEQARLSVLEQAVSEQLKAGRLEDAPATADELRWELATGECRVASNSNSAAVWSDKRTQLGAEIQRAEAGAASQAKVAADQAAAADARAAAAQQAEAEKAAEQLKAVKQAEQNKASQAATESRKASNEKNW